MQREPFPQLLHEVVGIVEQAVDQIDDFAVQLIQPRRQPLASNLGRIAARIMDGDAIAHVAHSGSICER